MKLYQEFKHFEIIIVIGGFYKNLNYVINKNENITYIYCNHNSIDFTGLIALLELYNENTNDYYLYLHDTCKIGEHFYKKIISINLDNVTSIRINKWFSMNIGIYSQNIINKFNDFLLSRKNNDDNKCIEFKKTGLYCEDFIFKNDPNNTILDNFDGCYYTGPFTGPSDYYNTGVMRIVEYYPNLDLYKMLFHNKSMPAQVDLIR
jgi:hypothetical protein